MPDFLLPLLAQAAPAAGTNAAGSGDAGASFLIPMIAMFAIFYFLLIRPQQKRQKEQEKMISELKTGDRVVTVGGAHGVISSVKEKTVVVRVAENTRVEFDKSAIASSVKETKEKETSAAPAKA